MLICFLCLLLNSLYTKNLLSIKKFSELGRLRCSDFFLPNMFDLRNFLLICISEINCYFCALYVTLLPFVKYGSHLGLKGNFK